MIKYILGLMAGIFICNVTFEQMVNFVRNLVEKIL